MWKLLLLSLALSIIGKINDNLNFFIQKNITQSPLLSNTMLFAPDASLIQYFPVGLVSSQIAAR
jgi:hypothetical protein